MQINEIVAALNQEISRLEQVRNLLANSAPSEQTGKRRGRPKGSVNKPAAEIESESPKRQMSAEGRARIAEAQRKRWAASKQTGKSGDSSLRKRSASSAAEPSKPGKRAKKGARQRRAEAKPSVTESAA
jgi:hypothetical protein